MKREYVAILMVALLLMALAMPVEKGTSQNAMNETTYTTHGPIYIYNDTDFADQAAEEGWAGNGSEEFPYIIENYSISQNDYCVYIRDTVSYFVIRNCALDYAYDTAVYLSNVRNGVISNNEISYAGTYGIYLYNSKYNMVSNNSVDNNNHGIYLSESDNNMLFNNSARENEERGIYLSESNNNTLKGNRANNNQDYNGYGIYISYSNNNTLEENTASWNYNYGIYLSYSNNNTLEKNVANGNYGDYVGVYGIYLYKSNYNVISNNSANNNFCDSGYYDSLAAGIYIYFSKNNLFLNNTCESNSAEVVYEAWEEGYRSEAYGMYLVQSSKNIIKGNIIEHNPADIMWGFALDTCNDNIIDKNKIIGGNYGFFSVSSKNNSIRDNIIENASIAGIYMENSMNTTIEQNHMNSGGIMILGDSIESWNTHHIDNTNTFNSKSIIYLSNRKEGSVPSGAGEVILANCTGITISHQQLSNATVAIELGFSDSNEVLDNTISFSEKYGIYLFESKNNSLSGNSLMKNRGCAVCLNQCDDNLIKENLINDNKYGIFILDSRENTIDDNLIANNHEGMLLQGRSHENEITRNNFSYNSYGMYLNYSDSYYGAPSNNKIFHNNFINNSIQANDEGDNFWNASYPSGGNYWSDYDGQDIEGDPDHQPGADGIGDSPYIIGGYYSDIQDDYPLMLPWGDRDTDPPHIVITYPRNNTMYGPEEDFVDISASWRGWDNTTGINHYEVKLDNGNWTYFPVWAYDNPYYEINAGNGNHTFYVKAVDAFGNENISSVDFTIDFIAPEVNITDVVFSSENGIFDSSYGKICVNWSGYDNISGIANYSIGVGRDDYSPEEITWLNIGLKNHYCYNFTHLSDGRYLLYVGAIDRAGNGYDEDYYYNSLRATDSISFMVDTTPPQIEIKNPSWGAYTDGDVQVSWQGDDYSYSGYYSRDYGSGIDSYEIRIDNGSWIDVGRNTTYDISNLSEGQHSAEIKATDIAGNKNIEKVNFTVDLSPPTVKITSPSNDAVFGTGEATIWWIGNDSISGISHYEIRIDSGPWQDVGKNSSYFFKGIADGEHTVEVKVFDLVGNTNTTNVTFRVGYGIISGKVVDENANPIVGAEVILDTGESAITDSNGTFKIITGKGQHILIVKKEGYKERKVNASVTSGEVTDLSVSLPQSTKPEYNEDGDDIIWLWVFLAVLIISAVVFLVLVEKGVIDPDKYVNNSKNKKDKKKTE